MKDNAIGLVNAKHGNFMFYNYDEFVGTSIREYGEWSEKLLQKILLLINESDYVIDIGSHVGLMTIPIAKKIGDKVQLVGDDLFVTNVKRLSKGISKSIANSILIKVNQIGTLSETFEAVKMAHKAGYTAVMSHRSGETSDSTIADLAVAMKTCQIKTGSASRSDRMSKYNQLLRIEERLSDKSIYLQKKSFNINF